MKTEIDVQKHVSERKHVGKERGVKRRRVVGGGGENAIADLSQLGSQRANKIRGKNVQGEHMYCGGATVGGGGREKKNLISRWKRCYEVVLEGR